MAKKLISNFDRFVGKIEKQKSGCWRWTGNLTRSGAGLFRYSGKSILAHRASCLLHGIPVQSWHYVRHSCRHTWCVAPEHLELLTRKQFYDTQGRIPPKPGMVRITKMVGKLRRRVWVTQKRADAFYAQKNAGKPQYRCRACGKTISAFYTARKYCSGICRKTSYDSRRNLDRKCARCSAQIPFKATASYRAKYCGQRCAHAAAGEFLAFANPTRRAALLRATQEPT